MLTFGIPIGLIFFIVSVFTYFMNQQADQENAEAEAARRIREAERRAEREKQGQSVPRRKRIPRRHR